MSLASQFNPTVSLRNFYNVKTLLKMFKNNLYTCKPLLMKAYERFENARDNLGKFINQFQPKTKTLVRKLERILLYQAYSCKERTKHSVGNQTKRLEKNLTIILTNKKRKVGECL